MAERVNRYFNSTKTLVLLAHSLTCQVHPGLDGQEDELRRVPVLEYAAHPSLVEPSGVERSPVARVYEELKGVPEADGERRFVEQVQQFRVQVAHG